MVLGSYFDACGPGAALGIARDGEAGLRACLGLADIGAGAPITPRTSFDLASVSKVFTGAAVMLLCERGRLRLDDPIARHLPGMGEPDRRPVTIRDLLWHTSGLPDYLAVAAEDESLELVPEAV